MNIDELLEAVEQVLCSRQLSLIEQFVLHQSWLGQSYSEMAENSAYGISHVKEIGSQLWQDLSEALGEKVTKKNLHLVLKQYQQKLREQQLTEKDLRVLAIPTKIKFPSGPVPLNSPFYINRPPIEELGYAEITQPGCVIRIKAPSTMGKSSLLNRILARAVDLGYETVYLDFQEADEAVFASLDKFLRWFCANISRQLQLNPMLDEYWDEEMGSKVSCKIYFQGYLLEQINSPVVLALNEVNRVFEHPDIAQEFLPMLRFWHEQARSVEIWQKLRVVVVHATEVYIPLKLTQSPFNVGLLIKLPEFKLKQVEDLAVRYGLDWRDSSKTQQLMAMVGGHPYLVNLALYHLRQGEITLEKLLQAAPTLSGIYSHHLRSHLTMLLQEPKLADALQQVVTADGSVRLEAIAAYKLESMGLVQVDGDFSQLSCELYRLFFRSHLRDEKGIDAANEQLEKELPGARTRCNLEELTQLNHRYD